MTFTKIPLAALILGASLTPALAESGDTVQTPVAAFVQALATPTAVRPAVIEGRQATPVAVSAPSTDAAARYLDSRKRDQDR